MKWTQRWKTSKSIAVVYFVLRLSVLAVMIIQIFNRNYENVFLCALTLILFLLPAMMERRLKIEVPDLLEGIILVFIFAAEILGEISEYYITFPYWDTLLHTVNGFLAAAVGFSLADLLNEEERVSLSMSPFFMAVLAFCFSMTIGVLWEFFEFAMDQIFLLDMQKDSIVHAISTILLNPDGHNQPVVVQGISDVMLVTEQGTAALQLGGYLDTGLADTMADLLVNFGGATVFSVFGYFYVKNRGKSRILHSLLLRKMDKEKRA